MSSDTDYGRGPESPILPYVPKAAECREISNVLRRVGKFESVCSFGGEAFELPVLPGLTVARFGKVSLPLCAYQMQRLARLCVVEGDGVWALMSEQVKMTNPEWGVGIRALGDLITERLGFRDTALQPELSKMVVLGPGGGLGRQRNVVDNDREKAKLVVQLPSEHTGGDLLVFEDGTQKMARYVIGSANGIAEFKPQYAVYAADSEYAVEDVTSGFSLLLVYTLCLPQDGSIFAGKAAINPLQIQLAQALMQFKGQNEIGVNGEENVVLIRDEVAFESSRFALMLSKGCSKARIEKNGVDALFGVDQQRFQLLRDVNVRLPPGKQFKFYIASLRHKQLQKSEDYRASNVQEIASWYLINGEKISDGIHIKWTEKLEFLNPDLETLVELWKNDHFSVHRGYERFAIVGWPASSDIANTYTLMGELASIVAVLAENPVDATKLRLLCKYLADQQKSSLDLGLALGGYTPVSLEFCQKFCIVIVELGDLNLVAVFLDKFFPRVIKRDEAIPLLASIARAFGWAAVGKSLINAINGPVSADIRMTSALMLADALKDDSAAQTALTTLILEKARHVSGLRPSLLAYHDHLDLLWKHVVNCEDKQVLCEIENLFNAMDPKLLSSVVNALSECVDGPSPPEHHAALTSIASKRRQWLAAEIAEMEKTFTWELPDIDFPDAASIKTFLEGSQITLEIQGFRGVVDARKRAKLLNEKVHAPLEITTEGKGRKALVRMTKACGVFATNTTKMAEYMAEMDHLTHLLEPAASSEDDHTNATGKKRPREEEVPGAAAA